MSDDISMNDFMVLQDAALDASFRRLSMQNAAMRNQCNAQPQAPQRIMTLETKRIPLAHDGVVIGTAYLQHRTDNPNCSLLCGREVKDLKFRSKAEQNEFVEKICRQHDHKPGIHTTAPCPECFPQYYKEKNEAQTMLLYARDGARYANDIGLEKGYYMRREDIPFVIRRSLASPTTARFFHMAGHSCEMRVSTTLVGPYKDLYDASKNQGIPRKINGILNLPCPACYGEEAYNEIGLSREAYLAILAELKLAML